MDDTGGSSNFNFSWSKGLGAAGSTMGAIGSWIGVWANYNAQMANAQSIRNQATANLGQKYTYEARAYINDLNAEQYMKQVGEYEKAGRNSAYQRTLQLGQDIGRVYAGATGGGIDASSAVVKNVASGTRKMAAMDVDAINTSSQQAQWTAIRNSSAARQEAIFDRANARMAELNYQIQLNNAKMAEEQAGIGRTLGILSAIGSTFGAVGGWVGAFGG